MAGSSSSSAMKVKVIISVLPWMILLFSVLAEAQPNGPKPQKVKCLDKNYPQCYQVQQTCPDVCSRSCYIDCLTCLPVCTNGNSSWPQPYTPPTTATPPPPPSSNYPPEVSGRRVFCRNRNYPSCYRMAQRCPAACPDQCEVDCVTCSPVCSKLTNSLFLSWIFLLMERVVLRWMRHL